MKFVASRKGLMKQAFKAATLYEEKEGPLFSNDATSDWKRADFVANVHTTAFSIMQGIVDFAYTSDALSAYASVLDGYRFMHSDRFPGRVESQPDPNKTHTTRINASQPKTFGTYKFTEWAARRPTGTYLAPGSIATVTVPRALVGQGYTIRVGAHAWDHDIKKWVKRLDRSSIDYEINNRRTQIASPLGGGIYVEVPYLADAGVVNIQIKNAVRSPYFSMKSFHNTSLSAWQNVERLHGAPWADFQTEKYMAQVPTSWIYNLDDPRPGLRAWDAGLDAVSDLMGFPHVRGKEVLYMQVDTSSRRTVHSQGYPQCNAPYDPDKDYSSFEGNKGHYLITGPQHVLGEYELHEVGHSYGFQKFPGEEESAVNLLHVAVLNQLGVALDEAFYGSHRHRNDFMTLANTAVTWMTCENFVNEQRMVKPEMSYQLKGHAWYVEIARLFGWDALGRYWHAFELDDENQNEYSTDVDSLILRMSKAVRKDVTPLLHFWGRPPEDYESLRAALENKNLLPSAAIHDALVAYRASIPKNNAAFRAFAESWWEREPRETGHMTESYHAELWTTYDRRYATDVRTVLNRIIKLYFPNGRP